MPASRRQRRGRTVLTIDSFAVHEMLAFLAGWEPPQTAHERSRSRWATWKQFLNEWEAIRDEWLTGDLWKQPGETAFAEIVLRQYGPQGPPQNAMYDDITSWTG